MIKTLFLIWLGKIVSFISRFFNLGAGSTWPGHIALALNRQILSLLGKQLRLGIILIAGTNGKTTTAKMLKMILGGLVTIHNESGANLLNGIVSALILAANWRGRIKADYGIFEVDEATLPLVIKEFPPKVVVCLNLFRDQLDRYGEVDQVAEKWQKALQKLPRATTVVLNADDPHIAYLGKNLKTKIVYFGLDDPRLFLGEMEHAVDSVYCPSCGRKLNFAGVYFSHLGHWSCPECNQKRPRLDQSAWDYPIPGVYNRYNTLAAVLVAKAVGVKEEEIKRVLVDFKPAFGRQEELRVDDKKIKILLSKNPVGFNESIRTLKDFPGKKKTIIFFLNDRIPDGRDVSWIWDVDFENLVNQVEFIITSGDRPYDMGLRIKYSSSSKFQIEENLKKAIDSGLKQTAIGETLYILPTYSAMLEIRKILSGRKIL